MFDKEECLQWIFENCLIEPDANIVIDANLIFTDDNVPLGRYADESIHDYVRRIKNIRLLL